MTTVPLDYGDLRIIGETRLEREVRAHSAAKEPETVAWVESLPRGSVLYDVGANVGAYTLIAASLGLRVVAFEPAWFNVASLMRNLELNDLDAVVLPVALGAVSRAMRLQWSSDEAGAAGCVMGSEVGSSVPMFELDDLWRTLSLVSPDALKIDVDGYEVRVLHGAHDTLRWVRTVLVETVPDTSSEVGELLRAAGLRQTGLHFHERSGVTNEVWCRMG